MTAAALTPRGEIPPEDPVSPAPQKVLGLAEGDCHVIRNAGGVVTDDAIRSLAISQRLLGTEEIILIHHTDCGMVTFSDDEFRRGIQEIGVKPQWAAEAFPDAAEDVRQSIGRIQASPFIPRKTSVRGFLYHVEDGSLQEVDSHAGRQMPQPASVKSFSLVGRT